LSSSSDRKILFGWTMLAAFVCHFLFSHLGFNIGDDGFVVAMSERILKGQFPHRDFISVRPIGSAILWAPVVAFSGKYAHIAVRFFSWIQFSLIAFFWISINNRQWKIELSTFQSTIIHTVTLFLGSSIFTYYGWNTLDGLFFTSLGAYIYLHSNEKMIPQLLAFLLIGLAPLFKQNFLAVIPLSYVCLCDIKKKYHLLFISIFPSLIYLALIRSFGGWEEMRIQFTSYTSILGPGFFAYIQNKATHRGVIFGLLWIFSMRWMLKRPLRIIEKFKAFSPLVVCAPLLLFFFYGALVWWQGKYTYKYPFTLFGFIFVLLLTFIVNEAKSKNFKNTQIALFPLGVAWVTGISGGYITPILGGAPIISLILLFSFKKIEEFNFPEKFRAREMVVVIAFFSFFPCWIYGRYNFIYGEYPASKLVHPLDGLLPGGSGLYTTKNNYLAFKSLNQIVEKYENYELALIPDYPGFWVGFHQLNPLPIDWANVFELANPKVYERFSRELKQLSGSKNQLVVLQKFAGYTFSILGEGEVLPLHDKREFILHVQKNFTLIDENEFFGVYRP
jgi:hypothetical protein